MSRAGIRKIHSTYLEPLNGGCLFYPCAGKDLLTPIKLFAPFITDFVFVDKGYFRPGDQDTRYWQMDRPASQAKPVLANSGDYCLMGTFIAGSPSATPNDWAAPPCQLTEVYVHLLSGRLIRVHRLRDQGLLAIHRLPKQLSVFFYRGDSDGGGGSGDHWLSETFFDPVLSLMRDGGLVVTDGSNTGRERRNAYRRLRCTDDANEMRIHGNLGYQLLRIGKVDTWRSTHAWQVRDLSDAMPWIVHEREEALRHARDDASRFDVWGYERARADYTQPIVLGHQIRLDNKMMLAASSGDPLAQTLLGAQALTLDEGKTPDLDCAIAWLTRAADQGHVPAIRHLARLWENGSPGLPPDRVTALSYWMRLASRGNRNAQYRCAVLLRKGVFPAGEDLSKAEVDERILGYCRLAADQQHRKAMLEMGTFCENGFASQGIDLAEALKWYERLGKRDDDLGEFHEHRLRALHGDAHHQRCLADCYRFGWGCRVHLDLARDWYRRAAQAGDRKAIVAIAELLAEDGKLAEADFHLLEAAAGLGSEPAMRALAAYFSEAAGPDGQPRDQTKAVSWLERLTDCDSLARLAKHHVDCATAVLTPTSALFFRAQAACDRVRSCSPSRSKQIRRALLEHLVYSPPDLLPNELIPVYLNLAQSTAHRKDPMVALSLARLWDRNGRLAQDDAKAAFWFRRSANCGSAEAQFALAALYLEGRGVERDEQAGLAWMNKAARSGLREAKDELARFAQSGNRYAQRALDRLSRPRQHFALLPDPH